MGTVSTKSKDVTLKISESMDESTEVDFKINLIKNNHNNTQSFHQSETTENTKKTELSDLKPFKFEWKEGGNDVKISGSFLENWNKEEEMIFNNDTKVYEITLNVPKGLSQFKFIVNGKWVCSSHYKVVNDNNNNFNNEIYIGNNSENNNNSTINSTNNQEIKKRKKKSSKGSSDYNCIIPSKSVVNAEAPIIPYYYKSYINLDHNSNQLDSEKFKEKLNEKLKNKSNDKIEEQEEALLIDKTKRLIEDNTFKSIMVIPHEKLSHLFYYCDNDNKYIRNAITQRSKHKFLTIVYFSPKK